MALDQPSGPTLEFDRVYDRYTFPRGVVQTDDGGYAIAGLDREGWLLRTDPRGDPLFTKTFYTSADSRVSDIVTDDDGGFVLLGISYDQGCWLRSLNAEGETCWFRTYKDCSRSCSSLVRTESGGYAWITNVESEERTRGDYEVHVVDEDGATVWRRSYQPEDAERYRSFWIRILVQLEGGGFALVGTATLDARRSHIWVVRVDADGERLGEATYESPHPEWEYAFVPDAVPTTDGGVALVGSVSETSEQIEGEFLFLTLGSDLEPETFRTYDPRGCGLALGNALVQTADGGFALLGEGAACEVEDRYRYAFVTRLLRLEPDGSVRWTYTYPEDVPSEGGTTRGLDVIETADGGLVAVGRGGSHRGPSGYDGWLFKVSDESSP